MVEEVNTDTAPMAATIAQQASDMCSAYCLVHLNYWMSDTSKTIDGLLNVPIQGLQVNMTLRQPTAPDTPGWIVVTISGAGANGDFLVIGTDHRIRAAFGLTRGFADFVIQYVYTNKRAWL